jgi:hypothetical protein
VTARYGPWREPREETVGLYPGLVVDDGRMTGSITIGPSRLPVWAILGEYFTGGWDDVVAGWPYIETEHGFTENDLYQLFRCLANQRGEFGRLLLVLADAERLEAKRGDLTPWWKTKRHRKRVADQLRRCLEVVEGAP